MISFCSRRRIRNDLHHWKESKDRWNLNPMPWSISIYWISLLGFRWKYGSIDCWRNVVEEEDFVKITKWKEIESKKNTPVREKEERILDWNFIGSLKMAPPSDKISKENSKKNWSTRSDGVSSCSKIQNYIDILTLHADILSCGV